MKSVVYETPGSSAAYTCVQATPRDASSRPTPDDQGQAPASGEWVPSSDTVKAKRGLMSRYGNILAICLICSSGWLQMSCLMVTGRGTRAHGAAPEAQENPVEVPPEPRPPEPRPPQ